MILSNHTGDYLLGPPPLGVARSNCADGSLSDHGSKARSFTGCTIPHRDEHRTGLYGGGCSQQRPGDDMGRDKITQVLMCWSWRAGLTWTEQRDQGRTEVPSFGKAAFCSSPLCSVRSLSGHRGGSCGSESQLAVKR